jgi:hypothetical protein
MPLAKLVRLEVEPPSTQRLRGRVHDLTVRRGPSEAWRADDPVAPWQINRKMRGGFVPSSRYIVALSKVGRRPWLREV